MCAGAGATGACVGLGLQPRAGTDRPEATPVGSSGRSICAAAAVIPAANLSSQEPLPSGPWDAAAGKATWASATLAVLCSLLGADQLCRDTDVGKAAGPLPGMSSKDQPASSHAGSSAVGEPACSARGCDDTYGKGMPAASAEAAETPAASSTTADTGPTLLPA